MGGVAWDDWGDQMSKKKPFRLWVVEYQFHHTQRPERIAYERRVQARTFARDVRAVRGVARLYRAEAREVGR